MMRRESVSLLSSTICAVNKLAVVQSSLTHTVLPVLSLCANRSPSRVGPSARSAKRLFQKMTFALALTLKAPSTPVLAGATPSALVFLASTPPGPARSALRILSATTWLTQREVSYLVVLPRLQRTFPLRPTRKQRIRAPRKKRSFRQWTNSRPNGKRWPTRNRLLRKRPRAFTRFAFKPTASSTG
jgi:hypothetical protein